MTREQAKAKQDNWKYRRAMSFFSAGSIIAMLGYLVSFSDSTNVVQLTLAQSLPFALMGIITVYIGGPIADDWLQFRKTA